MTRDDIIRMAREAGISKPWDQEPVKWETLERFAALVAAAEREACAKTCEELRLFDRDKIGYSEAPYKLCALGIRERGAP